MSYQQQWICESGEGWKEGAVGRKDGHVARRTLVFVLDMPIGVVTAIWLTPRPHRDDGTIDFHLFLMSATDNLTDTSLCRKTAAWETSGGHMPNDPVEHRYSTTTYYYWCPAYEWEEEDGISSWPFATHARDLSTSFTREKEQEVNTTTWQDKKNAKSYHSVQDMQFAYQFDRS